MASREEVEVSVRAIASGGAGVADLPDGRVAFVQRTAPGDRARVRVTQSKKTWAKAALVELIEPGPGRREAPCPFYARCGGCTLQHLEYGEQLRWKGRIVADALARIGGLAVASPEVVPSPCETRYRNRVTFTLKRIGGGRVLAGFHELDEPDRLVDIDGRCLLPDAAIARAWEGLRAAWGEGAERLPGGHRLRLSLRSVANGVVLVVDGGGGSWAPEPLLRDVPGLVAIWHQESGAHTPLLVAGDGRAHEVWLGEPVRPGARAFLQVNREAAELLHAAALSAAEVGLRTDGPLSGRCVDAYCGVGAYGRALARAGAHVIGIELDPEAAAAAREGAPEGFTVLEGPVERRLAEALPSDVAILNPPRTGLHEDVPRILSEQPVQTLVYVSCDPATLARDLGRLVGYRLLDVQAFDLFPQTAHVETLAVLERAP